MYGVSVIDSGSNGNDRFDNGNYEIESYPQPPWYFGAVGVWSNLISTDDRLEGLRKPPDGFADTITVVEKIGSTSSLAVQQVLALEMKLCIGHKISRSLRSIPRLPMVQA